MKTYAEMLETWTADIRPAVIEQYGTDDESALSESWNEFTDAECKEGNITNLQYHYCPPADDIAVNDDEDDDREFILGAMGVKFSALKIARRDDGIMTDMPDGSSHWKCEFKRGNDVETTLYSMGPAHTGRPEMLDVLGCLLSDTSGIDGVDFEEWAADFGFDPDSRKAERSFKACQEIALKLGRLFSSSELDGLREIFADR